MGTTLAEKVWADHLVRKGSDGAPDLLYIDLMLMHEVTSPQAFEGLRLAGRKPRHVDQLIATEDHNTPTVDIDRPNPDETSALQLTTLEKNCKEFGVRLHPLGDADQGIVHAFAPILGLTQPGMTIVCGDSHTSTHGAFGALAFGIGTSEVEHVMATQTLSLKPFKTMAVNVNGKLPADATAKDIILAIIAKIGTGGGQGHVIEYRGEAIRNLTMDERMTVCNMSIEAGARAGMIAPDETTFEYLKGRPHAPEGEMWDRAVEYWKTLKTDDDAMFDKVVDIDATKLGPFVTWGTNPGQGLPITANVPEPDKIADATKRAAAERAITYMGLKPGMTIVCGDSHTSTHGAFGALAFGIGTSEVEHVMATQTLSLKPFKTMAVNVNGKLPADATAKDIILAIIAKIGTGGGQGYVIEYRGEAIRNLTMDERMTVCNMSIEAGARAGMIAPDETTFEYLKGRPHAPEGELWDQAVAYWKTLKTDDDAVFDKVVDIDATKLGPYVTWGTNPGQGLPITASVPEPGKIADATKRAAAERAITYMGLKPGMPIKDIAVDTVFIGSCTNGRIDDLRQAAAIMKGHRKAENIHRVLVVPASSRVRLQAEKEGLDKVFKDFGAEWRNAGCSMCLGMNPDKLVPNERSISTSNRNFEGRQGKGSRTHLASPAVAAATAIRGTISSPADL